MSKKLDTWLRLQNQKLDAWLRALPGRLWKGFLGILKSTTLQVMTCCAFVGVLFTFGFSATVGYLGRKFLGIEIPYLNYVGAAIAVVAYASSLSLFWITTPANKIQIVLSVWPDFGETPDIKKDGDIGRPEKQHVFLEGTHGKWPWWKRIDKFIDLKTEAPLDVEVEAPSSDSIPMVAKFVGTVGPIPGQDAVYYDRSDDAAAVKIYKGRISIWVEKTIRDKEADKLLSDPEEAFKDLNKIFEGEKLGEIERKTGRIIRDLRPISIEQDPRAEKLKEGEKNAKRIKKILKTVLPACNGNQVLEQDVAKIALQAEGLGSSTINLQNVGGRKGKSTP